MKKILFILLGLAFLAISCQDDPIVIDADLHLDGVNFSAPVFDPGTHSYAVRFSGGFTTEFTGREINEVEFYLADIPNQVIVKVLGEGTSSLPGNLLYEADVTSEVVANSWNQHSLSDAVPLFGDDTWIAIEISQSNRIATIGCDEGPAVVGGDWINTTGWETFRDFSGGESINWNIRANLSE